MNFIASPEIPDDNAGIQEKSHGSHTEAEQCFNFRIRLVGIVGKMDFPSGQTKGTPAFRSKCKGPDLCKGSVSVAEDEAFSLLDSSGIF